MPGVILHAGQLLDQTRDPRQGPEVRGEAMRPRALAQGRVDAGQLLRRQPRLAPRPPRGPQRRAASLAPRPVPPHDALATGAEASGDGGLRLLARGKEPRSPLPTKFQSMEIPPWCHMSTHTSIIQ